MIPLSDSRIRIVWQAPDHNGGAPITKYVVQLDTEPELVAYNIFITDKQDNELVVPVGILNNSDI